MKPPKAKTVGLIVLTSIVLTAFHFSDTTISLDTYPAPGWQPDWFGYVVAGSWFVFTAIGIRGYLLYRDGRFPTGARFPAVVVGRGVCHPGTLPLRVAV